MLMRNNGQNHRIQLALLNLPVSSHFKLIITSENVPIATLIQIVLYLQFFAGKRIELRKQTWLKEPYDKYQSTKEITKTYNARNEIGL